VSQNQASSPADAKPATAMSRIAALIPGILLCIAVAGVSALLERAELGVFEHPYVEALVMAILLGMALRSFWKPAPRWQAGIAFSAKQLLEVAVMLLGASISFAAIAASGIALLASIAAVVVIALCVSFGLSRLLGLSTRLSILIACGNSICGNSAIVAVASVIGADGDEVASSIAFTAVLGVIVVLTLPLIGAALHMSDLGYGALAGLTVYAVPQVLAAAAPAGAKAVQMGTLVKLARVVMLGPACLAVSLFSKDLCEESSRPPLHQLVPWFIIGFLAMVALRSADLIPVGMQPRLAAAATLLTVASMAALGLGVDVRTVSKAGRAVTITVILSLLALGSVSFLAVRLLGL